MTAPPTEAWSLVGELEGYESYGDSWVTGFDGGYVAIGSASTENAATAWVSVDGRTWAPVALPEPDPVINPAIPARDYWPVHPEFVTSNGATVVIIGGYSHEPCVWPDPSQGDTGGGGPECPRSPISWASEDGMHWRSSLPWVGPVGRPDDASDPYGGFHQGSEFSAVSAVPGGWEAALFFWDGEGTAQREIWHSSDGLHWEQQAVVFDELGYDLHREVIVDSAGGRVISADRYSGEPDGQKPARLWSSTDGVTWTELQGSSDMSFVTGGVAPGQAEEPWLISGDQCLRLANGSDECRPAVWASYDLNDWQTLSLPGLAGFAFGDVIVVRSDRGYVAIGSSGLQGDGSSPHATWLSVDGITWVVLPDAPLITALANGPAGVIGFGDTTGDKIAVYQLR